MRNKILATVLGTVALASAQIASLRIAWWDRGNGEVPVGLLERARNANYNYIVVSFVLSSDLPALQAQVRTEVLKVHDAGLRIIPMIHMASKWSLHWRNLSVAYPGIQMNRHTDGRIWGCPSLAPDPPGATHGIDQAYNDVLVRIREGFNDAKLERGFTYNLEYVNLGHDEPVHVAHMIVGNDRNIGQFSVNDRNFLAANGGVANSSAYQRLFAGHVHRRIVTARSVINGSVRVMIFGDLWDPQANGGNLKTTNGGSIRMVDPAAVNAGTYAQGVASLPGLDDDQKATVRSGLIVIPWNYYYAWPDSGDPDGNGVYDAASTYAYLNANSLNFAFVGALDGRMNGTETSYQEGSYAMRISMSNARRYAGGRWLGYMAGYWRREGVDLPYWNTANPIYMQQPEFNTLEYLYNFSVSSPADVMISSF